MTQNTELAQVYCCPKDGGSLQYSSGAYKCLKCHTDYKDSTIVNFDVLKSEEALAFDAHHSKQQTLTEAEKQGSVRYFEHVIGKLGISEISDCQILEIACGKGEMTWGIANSSKVQNCSIHAFDHSFHSLEILANSGFKSPNGNQLFLSCQDVNKMAFADAKFDWIFGNACLHHFINYDEIVLSLSKRLKPAGSMIFTEPFTYGYFLAYGIWQVAYWMAKGQEHQDSDVVYGTDGTGLMNFILKNAKDRSFRSPQIIGKMTDKYFFNLEDYIKLARQAQCDLDVVNLEEDSYYSVFMDDLMNQYGIQDPKILELSKKMFELFRKQSGGHFGSICSHYKVVRMIKR